MTNQVIEKTENEKVTDLEEKVIGNFTKAELATLQSTIARGTTKEQFNLFIQICVNSGLNPFLNHVHCVTYQPQGGGPPVMSVQVAVEGVLHLARKQPGFKGVEAQLVHENDKFRLGKVDGKLTVTQHDIEFPRGAVVGGYSIAKREDFDDVLVIMETNEVEHLTQGKNSSMWKKWYADMFKKHMIKRAAKIQFGIEINDDVPLEAGAEPEATFEPYKPGERKEINEQETIIVTGEEEEEEQELTEAELRSMQWEEIERYKDTYKLEKSDITNIVREKFNKKPDALSLQELAALVKYVLYEGESRLSQPKKEKVNLVVNNIQDAEKLFAY